MAYSLYILILFAVKLPDGLDMIGLVFLFNSHHLQYLVYSGKTKQQIAYVGLVCTEAFLGFVGSVNQHLERATVRNTFCYS